MKTTLNYKNFLSYIRSYNMTRNNLSLLENALILRGTTNENNIYNKLYISYINNKYGMIDPLFYYDYMIDNLLHEGLITTLPFNIFLLKMLTKFNFESLTDYVENTKDNDIYKTKMFLFSLYEYDYNKNKIMINQFINKCGYFISNITTDIFDSITVVNILIEPKFITEATDFIYNEHKILYHITLTKRANKIMQIGLCPKAHNKKVNHPDRIYFYYEDYKNLFVLQSLSLYKHNGKYNKNLSLLLDDKGLSITVLKIDLSKFDKFQYRFFYDPNHPLGIFTYENIYPKCISEYMTFYI